MSNEVPGRGDQGFSARPVEQCQALVEQLLAYRGQVGLHRAPDLGEQTAAPEVVSDFIGQCEGGCFIGVMNQQHQIAIQRLLYPLLGELLQLAGRAAGQQLQQVGADRWAIAPLPCGQRHQPEQRHEEQPG